MIAAGTLIGLFLASDNSAEAQILRRRARTYTPPPAAPPVVPVERVQPSERIVVQPTEEEQIVQPAYSGSRRLSYFLQRPVHLNNGVTVGKVRDYVLNDQGAVEYFVVWYNGRYALIPYSQANLDWNRRYVTVDMNRARWDRMPTFAQNQWSTVFAPQSAYMNRLNSYFGTQGTMPATGIQVEGGAAGNIRGGVVPPQGGTVQGGANVQSGVNGTVQGSGNIRGTTTNGQQIRPTNETGTQSTPLPGTTIPRTGTQGGTTQPNIPNTAPGTRGPITPPQPVTPTLPNPRTSPNGPGVNPSGPGANPGGPGAIPSGPGANPSGPGANPAGPGNVPAGTGSRINGQNNPIPPVP